MKPITERVRNVKINPHYDACSTDLQEIYELAETDLYKALYTYFKFGYMKGQRAASAEAKKEAPCTTAIVQSAKSEPYQAQTYLTATDPKSQMFRDPAVFKKDWIDELAASGDSVTELDLEFAESVARIVHRAYRCGLADGQKGSAAK